MTSTAPTSVPGWLDVHAHFALPQTPEQVQTAHEQRIARCFLQERPFEWTVAGALDHMDRSGIAMQLLSSIPKTLGVLRQSNEYGATLVAGHPSRFGLLTALPTDDPDAAMAEIARSDDTLRADGFAVTCVYNGVGLGDTRLDPVWAELDRRRATGFVHPDAYGPPSQGRPIALLEVAFETARTVVDMLYAGVFRRFRQIRFVLAHCGGALPAVSGRILLLGAEPWVPNPGRLTREEMREQLSCLYLDTAAAGSAHSLRPALAMTTCDHLVYGSDCGVPCSTEASLVRNIEAILAFSDLSPEQIQQIGRNALGLFPRAAARLQAVAAAA